MHTFTLPTWVCENGHAQEWEPCHSEFDNRIDNLFKFRIKTLNYHWKEAKKREGVISHDKWPVEPEKGMCIACHIMGKRVTMKQETIEIPTDDEIMAMDIGWKEKADRRAWAKQEIIRLQALCSTRQ